jgi:hypothetical protein
MDVLEEKYMRCGYLLFSYEGLTETYENVKIYILMVSIPCLSSDWFRFDEHNTRRDSVIEALAKPFLFLLKKRFVQRLSTRKIIKEYKQEAKRRVTNGITSSKECEEEILLSLLERVMPMKKGEEIYWFRDYEYALLEAAIKETKQAIEVRFRPGNKGFMEAEESFAHTIEEIVNKQYC